MYVIDVFSVDFHITVIQMTVFVETFDFEVCCLIVYSIGMINDIIKFKDKLITIAIQRSYYSNSMIGLFNTCMTDLKIIKIF
ncbi:hypothetical protein BpHYR1_025406 [Brachionus plicatilis]|uniref:Uncharacterized protein n=1 Tax=Brachionus plicatilis TaxID=10195 RepID=A0A3M7Q984_BRAPC|nr:hypothetical protein BpHYR1_025406 [Brachionus plicatilis]